ncbi:hypothetical protein SALBM217S_01005 [Streptomyces griseoloalbus]
MIHIPALLQTTDHARALFRAVVPAMRQHEIEHRLTYRIKRQGILHREDPPAYSAIIHEAALRMGFGGPSVSHRQLTHLLDMGEMHHVTIQVVPFGTAHFPSTGQSSDYLTGAVPQLDTVQLDTHHGGCGFLDGGGTVDQVPSRPGPHGVVRTRTHRVPRLIRRLHPRSLIRNTVPTIRWRKSSYSGDSSNCVEAATTSTAVLIRDSKTTPGPRAGRLSRLVDRLPHARQSCFSTTSITTAK